MPATVTPNHDATATGASPAASDTGADRWGYAVWLWHWAHPHDPELAFDGAHRVQAPHAARRAKRDAIACFTSQIAALSPDPRDAAILPPPVLSRLTRTVEVLWLPTEPGSGAAA